MMAFGVEEASRLARLAMAGVHREYPNKLDHVINGPDDLVSPRALHPAFYGCFDWHSCVHGHWMLVHILRRFSDLPEAAKIRRALAQNLTWDNLQVEKAYLDQPNRASFERTYGWAWLLKLAEELHTWEDEQGRAWSRNLRPLAGLFVQRYLDFLPKQAYPIRGGTHPNTAFGLTFALDYARTVGMPDLEKLISERALTYYSNDEDGPARWEPSGADFLSPCLVEADLMRRVLPAVQFMEWLARFLPGLARARATRHGRYPEPANLFTPAAVSDRTDPQIVHLDGLNFSRAWCMLGIASDLPAEDPARRVLVESAKQHAEASLPHVASGDYMGEHWLATFAVYMLSHEIEFS